MNEDVRELFDEVLFDEITADEVIDAQLTIKSFEHVLGKMLGESVDGIDMISDREICFKVDGEHYKIPTQNVYNYIHKDDEIDLVELYDNINEFAKTADSYPHLIA